MYMKLPSCLLAAATLVCVLAMPQALAHKVNLFAYAEDGEVFVEGYFVDGKKAQNSAVEVYSPAGELLLEGVTNDEGQYRFPIPQHSDLKIVVNAGMGHQSEFVMAADELSDAVPQTDSSRTTTATNAATGDVVEPSAPVVNKRVTSETDELQAVVNHAVKEAIKPLVRELEESQQKASLSGIVGGVGYIMGFLGLFAYFKARQGGRRE
ncbi:hypothetical protein Tel_09590 [Candidatus Tenderia electrophaga]|jgi:nickel transport protein|uniref:Cobalt ABC transporter permease n=1 Tax=Candidatus Tenderia electrophaga TaxID=1748243 RepID=A0A0S2TE30_9GAMM|nr:hypothetical protein Tel_09590 [Candidatus Tenderia electrophaga]